MSHRRRSCEKPKPDRPSWSKHRPPWTEHGSPPDWRRNRGPSCLFAGLFLLVALMVVLILGAMAVALLLLTRAQMEVTSGGHRTTAVFWMSGCGLVILLPLLAMGLARRTFRRVAVPLSSVMRAADAVAAGDLTTRVPEMGGHGQFTALTRSFNHMIEELQRADGQRRNLTADVAHELRTPLHIIQGNLEGVLDGVYTPSPDHIKATLDETRTLARLVDDLHTLSKAEAGELSLRVEPLDMVELLTDVQTSFSGQTEAKGVALRLAFDGITAPLMIDGDAGRLDQVFSNLVANGLRHTPAGGEIVLSLARPAVVTITDTGEGIPAEEVPYIFDRFWRGDVARSHTDGAGAGLGLAIAKQLVEAHDGTIGVESMVGKGTVFTVSLMVR